MNRRVYYYGERDLEGLRWTARIIDFGIGLSVIAAFNEIRSTFVYLRESPLFRHKTKNIVNNTMRMIRHREVEIRSIMKDKSFWDDYSDTVIDAANNDVTLFRISIKNTLDKEGYKNSNIVSYMETARVLLEMSVQHFESVMADAKERYGRDYTEDFKVYHVGAIRTSWERATEMLYKGTPIDLNTPSNKAAFENMAKKFAEGLYIQDCLKIAMENNPDFFNNDIEIKDK